MRRKNASAFRLRHSLRSFATLLIERIVDSLQCAVISPQIEVVVD